MVEKVEEAQLYVTQVSMELIAMIAPKVVHGAKTRQLVTSVGTMPGTSQPMYVLARQDRLVGTARNVSLVIQTNTGAPLFADASDAPPTAISVQIRKLVRIVKPHTN
jgi:hypothetical protein